MAPSTCVDSQAKSFYAQRKYRNVPSLLRKEIALLRKGILNRARAGMWGYVRGKSRG